jgi:aspartate aminotransferase-like enzyme
MTDVFGRWFLPGPSQVHPDILDAMAHMGAGDEGSRLLAGLGQPLKDLFRTSRDVMLVASSATGLMEAAIRSGVEERVLVVIGGSYGERFAQVAQACGKDVVRALVPAGRTLEAEHLVQFLDGPEVDAVALVHSETSTGSLAPLSELARVIRSRKDVHILVDAAGSIGGCPVETDQWELDFVFAGSQKALALPPGLALGVASDRLLARAGKLDGRGRYFDLVRLARDAGKPSSSFHLPQYAALAVQLDRIGAEGGIEARWKRHHAMLKLVEEWVLLTPGYELLPPEGRRSWTVSCLRLPQGVSSERVVGDMKERDWRIGQGTGDLRDSTIRIGHMGDVSPAQLSGLLAALSEVSSSGPVPDM